MGLTVRVFLGDEEIPPDRLHTLTIRNKYIDQLINEIVGRAKREGFLKHGAISNLPSG